jgi:hypothetical protein
MIMVFKQFLDSAGLRFDQVRSVFLPPSDARAAFAGGSVDAWVACDPYFAEAETCCPGRANPRAGAQGLSLVCRRSTGGRLSAGMLQNLCSMMAGGM